METKYDHGTCDAQAQEKWEQEQTYTLSTNTKKPLFSIDTPPPTVSGTLHIGHIFSYTQTDIIARFKRLSGYNVFYPFGFDDNGLPTEKFVEKKHKITGFGMKRSEFINLCIQESHEAEKTFSALWQRMGISTDWSRTYSTISPLVRKLSQASFIELYKKGFIYRKKDPALYCTSCFTTVAQAELDDAPKTTTFCDITFKTDDGQLTTISTTRPELLPACVAVFYHPNDSRYQHLAGKYAITPLFNDTVPFLTDKQVDPEKGTGLVMCCTFGDKTDIHWYKTHKLPYKAIIGRDGKWLENTGILAGLRAHNAREKVIQELDAAGLITAKKSITHTVNVHERCKKEIEYSIIEQWFLDILSHKQDFLKIADAIEWHPSFMKARYKDWVEHLQWDWCLSRQRFYGIPFPAWHCNDCKALLLAEEKDLPIDPQEQSYPGGACPQCSSVNIAPDTDIMDTWNTSSITPFICQALYKEQDTLSVAPEQAFIPMSMRPQAHDIIRTWAFYTIIKAWMHNKTIPWKEIVISGHVLSSQKDKISKSQGNTPTDPEQLLQLYPADVIRYWTASGTLGHDVAFSEGQFKIGLRLLTKLWNAFRFIKEHIAQAPTEQPQELGLLNEWILHELSQTFTTYYAALEKHEFSHALHAFEKFFWNSFCDNYLELIKDQLFKPELYDQITLDATRWTLNHVGARILQLCAPYLPHITETLYGMLYQNNNDASSIHATEFAHFQKPFVFEKSVETMQLILTLITNVRKLKTNKELSLKTPLHSLTLHTTAPALRALIVPHEQLIKGVLYTQEIVYNTTTLNQNTLDQIDDAWNAHILLDTVKQTAQTES